MSDLKIDYVHGIAEEYRDTAVDLYESAFGQKFSVAVRSRVSRIELLSKAFQLKHAFGAICDGQLVGLAGYQDAVGSLTGGIAYRGLTSQLGVLRGTWAAMVFAMYERKPSSNELLMDGIAVAPGMRGQGIGSGLLDLITDYAADQEFERIRLDVVDTNPQARKLYERKGFVETNTEQFEWLRWLLGFGAVTTMVKKFPESSEV